MDYKDILCTMSRNAIGYFQGMVRKYILQLRWIVFSLFRKVLGSGISRTFHQTVVPVRARQRKPGEYP